MEGGFEETVKRNALPLKPIENFESIAGYGLKARIADKIVLAGKEKLLQDNGVATEPMRKILDRLAGEGKTLSLLAVDGVFVGSGIFKSQNPQKYAKAIVEATAHFNDPKLLAKVSASLGEPMSGIEISKLDTRLQERGI